MKPEWWGSPLGQEKYHEEKACDKRHPYHVVVVIIIIIIMTAAAVLYSTYVTLPCRKYRNPHNTLLGLLSSQTVMSVYVDGGHVQEEAFTIHTHTHTHTHAHTPDHLLMKIIVIIKPELKRDSFSSPLNTPTFEHNTSIHTIHAAKKWSLSIRV